MRLAARHQRDQVYALRSPDHRESRGDRWLLVWSDIPHWMVLDHEMHGLLCEMDGRRSLDDILAAHPGWTAMREDILAGIASMEQSGVVTTAGSASGERTVATPQPLPIENVALNITRRCNLRCKFCYNQGFPTPNPEDELSVDEIWRFLREIRPLTAKRPSLTILGGEPLMRPDDLLLLCARAKRAKFDTLASTNGTLITDSFARQAAVVGLQVQVSMDGHNAALHDAVRGRGTFDRTCAGIRTLVARNVHTIVSMVCHQGNLPHLEEFYDLALSVGAREARFIPLKQIGGGVDGGFAPVSTIEMTMAAFDLFKRRPELLRLAGRDAFSIIASTCSHSLRKTSCGTGLQTFLLDSDGSIYPCLNTNLPEFRLGGIRDPGFDFQAIWQQSAELGNYRKQTAVSEAGGACSECIVRHWCVGGCRGETYVTAGCIDGRSPGCSDLRAALIEMMWMIAERPDLVKSTSTAC